jgi:hypothetical protein
MVVEKPVHCPVEAAAQSGGEKAGMSEPSWHDLLTTWRADRIGVRLPSRSDIDPPIEVPQLLPNLMLIDVLPAGFRLRLVGSELVRRAGADNTGELLDPDRVEGVGLPTFVGFLTTIMAVRDPILYRASPGERSKSRATGLLLPLCDRTGKVQMILGGLLYEIDPLHDTGGAWDAGYLTELSLEDELKR